jgi:hypothetical protein
VKKDLDSGMTGTLTARFVGQNEMEFTGGVKGADGKVYQDLVAKWTRRK